MKVIFLLLKPVLLSTLLISFLENKFCKLSFLVIFIYAIVNPNMSLVAPQVTSVGDLTPPASLRIQAWYNVESCTENIYSNMTLREKCPNTELFLIRIFLYSG